MRQLEIETLSEFDRITTEHQTLRGRHLQSLDLTGRASVLSRVEVAGAVFLGCRFVPDPAPGSEEDVRERGGLVFPPVPDVPFDPYRAELYSPAELYADLAHGYAATPDARSYHWSRGPRTLDRTLAAALHDHAIDDALVEFAEGRRLVGVMGGHDLTRVEPAYRAAAELGRALAGAGTGFTVATGGGPGAMEAANLGAWLARAPQDALDQALTVLAGASVVDGVDAWASAAFEVLDRWPLGTESLGVPTWFYGHEPPNVFASVIAKYFSNAIREDVLVRLCSGGLVFLPGAAGTVQEIFQTACENYYAVPQRVVPMILVGVEYWSQQYPVWELLRVLGAGRSFGTRLELVDDPEDVLPLLVQYGGHRG